MYFFDFDENHDLNGGLIKIVCTENQKVIKEETISPPYWVTIHSYAQNWIRQNKKMDEMSLKESFPTSIEEKNVLRYQVKMGSRLYDTAEYGDFVIYHHNNEIIIVGWKKKRYYPQQNKEQAIKTIEQLLEKDKLRELIQYR